MARRAILALVVGAVALTGGTVASVTWIRDTAEGHLYGEAEVPDAPVALVLGTKVDADGTPSPSSRPDWRSRGDCSTPARFGRSWCRATT